MSYGVIASKSSQVRVERVDAGERSDQDVRLERFLAAWGGSWVPGRVALTRLHLSFLPNNTPPGSMAIDLALRDVEDVEVTGGRFSKRLSVRHGRFIVWIRLTAPDRLALRIAELSEAAKDQPDPARKRISRY